MKIWKSDLKSLITPRGEGGYAHPFGHDMVTDLYNNISTADSGTVQCKQVLLPVTSRIDLKFSGSPFAARNRRYQTARL